MENKAIKLSQELCALSDEDLTQIAGSGDEKFVNITDSQCEKIRDWCMKIGPEVSRDHMIVTNYGGPCPRQLFEQAKSMGSTYWSW